MEKIEAKPRLLLPPQNVSCDEVYSLYKDGVELYKVCISEGTYIVYDAFCDNMKCLEHDHLREILMDIAISEEPLEKGLEQIKDLRLRHLVERQLLGYGVLEPFLIDDNVVNIHIMANRPLQIIHKTHGRLYANFALSKEELEELALRLATAAGKVLSEASPLASFIEPRYEARVSVIYSSDVTLRKDMVLDIRRVPERPWTVLKLIHLGSLSFDEAAFLWLMIKYKVPIIIVGELMSGKTTLANALLALIPPNSRVITIEDAPEIRIPSIYWVRTTTREFGEYPVTVFDLLKIGVRLSVDYIIVGEIRGEEAREWIHAILLGHGGVTTFHAESPEAAILRLLAPPISVEPQALGALNVFVKTNVMEREPGKKAFRHEVYIHEEGIVKPLFVYEPSSDSIILAPNMSNPIYELRFLDRVTAVRRTTRDQLAIEYEIMKSVLREVYLESLSRDPELETPSYAEIGATLYNKLLRNLRGGL